MVSLNRGSKVVLILLWCMLECLAIELKRWNNSFKHVIKTKMSGGREIYLI
jgi:hypothetical protein